ncbi:hypothetical protein FHW58_001947 [Duganella sp. 1224]|uniref:hypothetical protein n=1 Tax=Duganella sp. 1224 TaxID=2587052 RepID=UPI0015CA4E8B|nr:hypothetical protein [Duganella sp. 1224]NYE60795.1 hypothetical protein [Duganella sp. 1224]
MASHPVTPVASVSAIRCARIRTGERQATYFAQLEEWRFYSHMLAAERRQRERDAVPFPHPADDSAA